MIKTAKLAIPFEVVEAKLGAEDDPLLWKSVLSVLTGEFLQQYNEEANKKDWAVVVGACSRWLSPNQTRWTAAGGFAFPEGYREFLPEFDWSVTFLFRAQQWTPLTKLPGKRLQVFRVAIPARTARHKQAAIHTRWFPGEERVLYGFRNLDGNWICVAASDEKSKGRILTKS